MKNKQPERVHPNIVTVWRIVDLQRRNLLQEGTNPQLLKAAETVKKFTPEDVQIDMVTRGALTLAAIDDAESGRNKA